MKKSRKKEGTKNTKNLTQRCATLWMEKYQGKYNAIGKTTGGKRY